MQPNEAKKDPADAKEEKPDSCIKSFFASLLNAVICCGILFVMAHFLDLWIPVIISLGFQMFVFFFHALPMSSERFYDLSGSMTHCLVIAASLVETQTQKSPRQVFCSMASIIWLTRLGSFLFLRIEKDGRDDRFG